MLRSGVGGQTLPPGFDMSKLNLGGADIPKEDL